MLILRRVGLIALLVLSVIPAAHARGRSKAELTAFFEKHSACSLAIGIIPWARGNNLPSGEPAISPEVLCVNETTANAGTIDEMTGCSLALYNVETNLYSSPYLDGEDPNKTHGLPFPIVKKSCKQGFDDLLNIYAGATQGATVADALTKRRPGVAKLTLLWINAGSSRKAELEKWWNDTYEKAGEPHMSTTQIKQAICNNCLDIVQNKEQLSLQQKVPSLQDSVRQLKGVIADDQAANRELTQKYKNQTGKGFSYSACKSSQYDLSKCSK